MDDTKLILTVYMLQLPVGKGKDDVMTFNPLKEKGIPLEKQIRTWDEIVRRPFNKCEIGCYSRTRQILLNGIEIEAWGFKHSFTRYCPDLDVRKRIVEINRIEDMQQTTINWLAPANQTILETTLGYEQVAVDLTAWLAQNEPDTYVKETYDFGLLEDFDHLYRYCQWLYMIEGTNPNNIIQNMTDVIISRPTQYHHNFSPIRIRKHYDKNTASPQTKANILTLLSGEQQTHNYYADHGAMYANDDLRKTYAEICDVEEEHVTMYESLIDPTESPYEKLLIHEFTEVCNYYTCYKDETDKKLKQVFEEMLNFEIEHLKYAAELFQKAENRDAEEVIGNKVYETCHFESQKEYVAEILTTEIDKRLDGKADMGYTKIDELPDNWPGYKTQKAVNEDGAPTEKTIELIFLSAGRDIAYAKDELIKAEPELLAKALDDRYMAPNTVLPDEYRSAALNNNIQI